jgi:hypothetical protein
MADGRCFTVNTSSRLYNNYLMKQNGITYEDNYSFRKMLQSKGPAILEPTQQLQGTQKCSACDKPLLKVEDIY